MKKPKTEAEKELLDCLYEITTSACNVPGSNGDLDSFATSDYAAALQMLAEYGRITIVKEFGRRIIARDEPQKDTE